MKIIEKVSIWDNGEIKEGKVFNTYASNVTLNDSATFTYVLYSLKEDNSLDKLITSGQVYMNPEEYAKWNTDDIAWDFVASKLKLIITGDYVAPIIEVTNQVNI
jgi:hypothetical protein